MRVPLPITYGDSIQLLGYTINDYTARPGDYALVTLYWRGLKPMSKDYDLRVESFSLDGHSFRNGVDFTPGHSVFPTSFWKPGDTFAETYVLPIGFDSASYVHLPTLAVFKATWFDLSQDDVLAVSLTPRCKDGQVCEPKFGLLPVGWDAAGAAPWAHQPAQYRLGEHIDLVEAHAPATVQAGQPLTVSVVWRANVGGLPANGLPALTTFVHLLPTEGKPVAQRDMPPRGGLYPTTVWRAGEIVPDTYSFVVPADVPSGKYRLVMGMYDAQTVERLPAFDTAGTARRDRAIPLQEVTITAP